MHNPSIKLDDERLIIGLDFDGTVVEHRYPRIGAPVPNCIRYLQELDRRGAKFVLFTMRSHQELEAAVRWFADVAEVPLFGIQRNPEQDTWTSSPKAYCHVYVDDAALGCPKIQRTVYPPEREYVDWAVAGPMLLDMLDRRQRLIEARRP